MHYSCKTYEKISIFGIMNKLFTLLTIGILAASCGNKGETCVSLNDATLVGDWKLVNGDVNFSLYKNGTGSFKLGKQPQITTEDTSRINWATLNGHTLVWDFYKNKGVWSYWVNGDTLNIHDGGIGSLNKPTVDEHWQFVRQK
jgi:hypothetical protein